ncbi:MAG: hypothetical protein LUF82_02095 [Clostridia bacterium]|nr:hypothetical protein [Clostridia bacterium]
MKKFFTCLALAAAFAIAACLPACAEGEYTLEIDDGTTYQTVNGWGASSAWWSQEVPQNSSAAATLAGELYSESGMGLTIYRYNIGGGSADLGEYGGNTATQSAFIAENYDYNKSALENFSDPDNYDFSRDGNAIEFLKLCCSQSGSTVQRIVLFCNSPHYLLTQSGTTHGAYEYQNNLPEENYEAFSAYILMYVDYFNSLGYSVYSVSPVNEPQNRWNGVSSVQEGCHFEPENLAAFYNVFTQELSDYNALNGTNIKTDVLESSNYNVYDSKGRIMEYIYEMSGYSYFDSLSSISVHSYADDTLSQETRKSFVYMLTNLYGDKLEIDMSEVCQMSADVDNGMGSGMWLAQLINLDMTILNASSWSWWLGTGDGTYNDGLLNWDRQSGEITYTKRYYVLSQYSSFIKSGYTRCGAEVSSAKDIAVSCYTSGSGKTVAVVVNTGKAATLTLPQNYSYLSVTVTDENYSKQELYSGAMVNDITLTAQSVTTLVFE